MKKVLFLVNHDVVIYNFRFELVKALIAKGYRVYVSSPQGERIKELTDIGCEYIETDVSRHGTNPVTDLKLMFKYIKILKYIRPDMVFSYTIKPNIYGGMACSIMKVPYVVNITGLGTAVENGGIMQKFTVMLYKLAFRRVQRVFLQNKENQRFFANKKIALGKHGLLPGSGVNLEKFLYLDYPTDEKIRFVFISRIMKEKGIDYYLDAAKAIKEKYPNTEFHICGFCEAEYQGRLQEFIDNNIVIYHGMVMDVREVLKCMHCTVHPTYYPEGLSNVLLESAASGRPLITTDRSGCREVIDNGVNGFIVKQKDTDDLIKKMEQFISLTYEQKKQMGIQGRKKVEKEFDRNIVVEEYFKELSDTFR